MRPSKIWSQKLGRYVEIDYNARPGAPVLPPDPKDGPNIIEILFRLFVFIFIYLPLGAFAIAVMWWSFGIYFVYFCAIMFVLVLLCYLSQTPNSQLTFGYVISTTVKAIVMTPVAIIGSFFIAKAPKGTVIAGGVGADIIRNAEEAINEIKK